MPANPRKHPPVSGSKRPLCALGVAPGRSRGIGGCARAPCVFLAAAEGTARGYGRVRGGKPALLPNWWSRVRAGAGIGVGNRLRRCKSLFVVTHISWLPLQTRCRTHAAALLAFAMSEALGSRPAPGTPSAKRSVGTRRAASMQGTLSEGTARAAQLAPSAVTASAVGGSATRGVVGRVSPTHGSASPATRLQRSQSIWVTTNTRMWTPSRLPTAMPAPAPTRMPDPGACTT